MICLATINVRFNPEISKLSSDEILVVFKGAKSARVLEAFQFQSVPTICHVMCMLSLSVPTICFSMAGFLQQSITPTPTVNPNTASAFTLKTDDIAISKVDQSTINEGGVV